MKKLILSILLALAPAYAQAQIVGQGAAGTENWLVTSTPATAITTSLTFVAAGDKVDLALAGRTGAGVQLDLVGYSGQLKAYVSYDGVYFFHQVVWGELMGSSFETRTSTLETAKVGMWVYVPPGATHVRIYSAAQTAGTVAVTLNANSYPIDSLSQAMGFWIAQTPVDKSLQIGGTTTRGGEWNAVQVSTAAPGAFAAGLVTRDATILPVISSNGGALPSSALGVISFSRSDSLMHIFESRDSTPLGTEFGLITRNIPSGTQAVSAASLPLPAGAATAANQVLLLASKIIAGDLVGTQGSTTTHRDSIQIGGATAAGNQWQQVVVTSSNPNQSDNALAVRDIQGNASPGSAAPTEGKMIVGRDPNTNIVRQVEVTTAAPAGTEGGVIVRNIPSGTQGISAASLPLPTGAATEATQQSIQIDATTTPLGISATYNSAWISVLNYGRIGVTVFADQNGAPVTSLKLQWSNDAVNTEMYEAYPVLASTVLTVQITPRAAWLKVTYFNSTVAQGVFRLYTIAGRMGPTYSDGYSSRIIGDVVNGNPDGGVYGSSAPIKIGCRAQTSFVAVTAGQRADVRCDTFGRIAVTSTASYAAMTTNAPATASVGVASAQIVASNASRRGLILVNLSNAKICLAVGATAVIDNGICLQPDAVFNMNEFNNFTGAINAIASAASSVVSIQEMQ